MLDIPLKSRGRVNQIDHEQSSNESSCGLRDQSFVSCSWITWSIICVLLLSSRNLTLYKWNTHYFLAAVSRISACPPEPYSPLEAHKINVKSRASFESPASTAFWTYSAPLMVPSIILANMSPPFPPLSSDATRDLLQQLLHIRSNLHQDECGGD